MQQALGKSKTWINLIPDYARSLATSLNGRQLNSPKAATIYQPLEPAHPPSTLADQCTTPLPLESGPGSDGQCARLARELRRTFSTC